MYDFCKIVECILILPYIVYFWTIIRKFLCLFLTMYVIMTWCVSQSVS